MGSEAGGGRAGCCVGAMLCGMCVVWCDVGYGGGEEEERLEACIANTRKAAS